jgi:hypothetical protein
MTGPIAATDSLDQYLRFDEAESEPTPDELAKLFSAGFDVVDVEPDGNCLFRSVAVATSTDSSTNAATSLRQDLVQYATTHPSFRERTGLQPADINYIGQCTPEPS